MKKIDQLKAGVLLSYLQMGLGMLISLIYTPFMLKLLGQSEYGLYNISSSIIAYLNLLTFGFGSSYIRYYAKYKKEENSQKIAALNGLFIFIFTVLGAVAFIAGITLSNNCKFIFDDGLTEGELLITKTLMRIMAFNMALSFPTSVFISYVTANEEFVFQKVLNMLKTVCSPIVTIIVLALGFKSVGMTLVVTAISLITDVINVVFCIRKLNMQFTVKGMDFRLLAEIAGFSIFIAINMIVDEVNWNVDKFLLGRFRGSIATSIYAIASTLNSYYRNISAAITNVFVPRVHKLVNSDNGDYKITELMSKIGRIQFMVLGAIFTGFVFLGKRFIQIWAGTAYSDAYNITILLIGPVIIPLIQSLGIEVQRAKNMHQFRSVAYVIMAIINIFVSIPLCQKYGGVGCAIGTAVSIVIANGVIMNVYYHKKIGINILYFWSQILKLLPSFGIPILAGLLLNRFAMSCKVLIYILFLLIYLVLCGFSFWLFGLNDNEKEMMKKFANIIDLKKR